MTDDTIYMLVASSNRGRYALDDPEQGHDVTSGEPIAILLGGRWIAGRIEHGRERYASEHLVVQRVLPGYSFIASGDGAVCGLCTGMHVQRSHPHMSTSEERRDKRFFGATVTALKDIEERALHLPQEQHYAAAYGILRGYVESLLSNFAEAFSSDQLAESRIVLDQLSKITGEDTHLDDATRAKLDQLAQALRESE